MALTEVGFRKFDAEPVALTSLEVGESVAGYCVGTIKSMHNNGADNLIFRDKETGETFVVYTAGNVRYQIQDGAIAMGIYTVITRLEDKMVKGKNSSQFQTQQDADEINPWGENPRKDFNATKTEDKRLS